MQSTLVSYSMLIIFMFLYPQVDAGVDRARVIDAVTKKPIEGAFVTLQDIAVRTDANGLFRIDRKGGQIGVRAYGYSRRWIDNNQLKQLGHDIELQPFRPKALYLSFFGIGDRSLRQSALDLIDRTELNALVIDVKGDRGMIPYRSAVSLDSGSGAEKIITIKDIKGLLLFLRSKGIYTIARIVTFKDNPLAVARPELAVRTRTGAVWKDREGLAWTDPFRTEVWDYNVRLAVEAAEHGFDEIQFDYVRFPDTPGLVFSMPNTEGNRCQAISRFLEDARKRLTTYNVFLAVDIFGYVCWNLNDTDIGQKIGELTPLVDYLSPMLYPSGYQFGIPGYRNPVAHPYEIVYGSLKRAQQRSELSSVRFRPWLQAFKDYAFDRRPFTAKEIRAQIQAAEDFGSNGWMLWNPRNVYSAEGLSTKDTR